MKRMILLILFFVIAQNAFSQQEKRDKEKENYSLDKTNDISDRAGGAHNASNIGLFFENRGKLYPRRITQGPSGEFPINSGKHYIYRVNPMAGVPGNVVQARYTTNEEWEAVAGYQNKEVAKIAFSDNPKTWPATGWPVKDANGNPIIKSDQDSYSVYSDSNNSRAQLGIVVAQTGYSYGVSFAKNLLFFKYDVINTSSNVLNDVYFGLYTDIDVGNISGGDPEYSDDRIGFIKDQNFLYFYDDGISNEWPGGKTGRFGVVFLQTPEVNGTELGITDWHYNLYDDDTDIDSIQYQIMSSSSSLYNSSYSEKFFHLGNNLDLHYDDVNTIPASGLDLVTNISSGPYVLNPGDTLTFITAFVAGENQQELMYSLGQAYRIANFDFEISKPPAAPTLSSFTSDGKVTLYWNDKAEASLDNFSGQMDFEGYRLYRSLDKGVNWELLKEYDIINDLGLDYGIEYSYSDSTVINGLEYWYTLTAFDRGDSSVQSLETPKGNTPDAENTIAVIASSNALGRTPVSLNEENHIGSGNSNYKLKVQPADNMQLAGAEYKVGFTYVTRQERGLPKVKAKIIIHDSVRTPVNKYQIEFTGKNTFSLYDFNLGDYIFESKSYVNGSTYSIIRNGAKKVLELQLFGPEANSPDELLPKKGDIISIAFGIYTVKNQTDTVISPRPFEINQLQATEDGVIFKVVPPAPIQDISRVGGTENFTIKFIVDDQTSLKDDTYLISVTGKGKDADNKGFVNLLVTNTNQDTVKAFDTVYTFDNINFNGLTGIVEFNSTNPPATGNIISVTTVLPKAPGIRDAYRFTIQGEKIDRQQIVNNMSNIKVVPNPYVVSSIYEPEFGELRREPLRQIQFINLPSECTITIFTIDADVVKTIHHNSLSGTATWDLRAEGGREIAPGIYLYLVKTNETEYLSRFAVIK